MKKMEGDDWFKEDELKDIIKSFEKSITMSKEMGSELVSIWLTQKSANHVLTLLKDFQIDRLEG
jgi:hypothetical protein